MAGLLTPRGDFKMLLTYQKAEILYDLTFYFAQNFFYLPSCVLRAEYGILHGMNSMEQNFNLRLSNLWLMISHGSCVV